MSMDFMTQDRIGVAVADWRLSLDQESIIAAADEGIRTPLRVMLAGQFETFESCQGGAGHAYPEPTIAFHGNQSEGFRAVAWLLTNGFQIMDLCRYWSIQHSEPHGPEWKITFPQQTRANGNLERACRDSTINKGRE